MVSEVSTESHKLYVHGQSFRFQLQLTFTTLITIVTYDWYSKLIKSKFSSRMVRRKTRIERNTMQRNTEVSYFINNTKHAVLGSHSENRLTV